MRARAAARAARRRVRAAGSSRAPAAGRRARRRRVRRGPDGATRRRAQADPGRADGGRRAPRARQPARRAVRAARLPLVSDRRPRTARSTASPAGRSRRARVRCRGRRRAGCSACRRTGPCCSSSAARLGARLLNELAIERFGAAGPAVLHLAASATTTSCGRACRGRTTGCFAFTDEFGAALGASDLVLARAGGSVWELAAAGKPACSSRTRSRPPTTRRRTRATSQPRGGAIVVPRERARARAPELDSLAARRSASAGGDGGRDAAGSPGRTPPTRSRRS